MTTAFAADAAGRVRAAVVHIRVGDSAGGAGVVWPGGVVVTNAHVATERRVVLRLPDGSLVEGETIWRDPARDLAAVTAPGLIGVAPVVPGDVGRIRPGSLVFAIGHPWGVRDAVSVGVFHRVGPLAVGLGVPEPIRRQAWVQAAVRLAPGNSGGPIADADGRVIGVSAMIVGGLGLAVPAAEVESLWRGARP
ncbi:MAG TPA: serine protease [Gemmatimonadales bacterium]|nr:serine protease [Gemmatimonadales bacterium]